MNIVSVPYSIVAQAGTFSAEGVFAYLVEHGYLTQEQLDSGIQQIVVDCEASTVQVKEG